MHIRQGRTRRCRIGVGPGILLIGLCAMLGLLYYSQRLRGSGNVKLKIHSVGHGGRQKVRQARQLPTKSWSCPLEYERTTYEEIREQAYKPYLLGGAQRPSCSNCHKPQELWSNFCQFKSQGPTCTNWDQWRLLDGFIQRAEAGAPGVKEMLTMTPCDLFQLLEGRTLWLVGDSLTQEFHRAIQCFFYEFWDLKTHDPIDLTEDPAAKAAIKKQPSGWCVFLMRRTRICHLRSNLGMSLADDILPILPKLGAKTSDILQFNFGVWHNDMGAFAGNLTKAVEYLLSHQRELPFLVWREAAPQHFDTPLGEFGCDGCPLPVGPYHCQEVADVHLNAQNQLESSDPAKRILVEGGWRNRVSGPVMAQLGIPILHIWNQSMPLWEYHHNFQLKDDCTHMCHPSAYQVWIFQFYQLLDGLRSSLPVIQQQDQGVANLPLARR